MSGEDWAVAVAAVAVALLIGGALVVLLDKKLADKDRYFTFMGLAIAAVGLGLSGWQNRLAANDARESAIASKDSAEAAKASLTIEKAPALTLNCNLSATGTPTAYFGLSADTAESNDEPLPLPSPLSPHIKYLTCVVNNYGRQPILNGELSTTLNFSPAGQTIFSTTPLSGVHQPRAAHMRIDGIAAGGSYTFWVGNEDRNGFFFQRPLSITFYEPDGTFSSFTFAHSQTAYLFLDGRTPFAPGEKHGFAKIMRVGPPAPSGGSTR